MKKLLRWAEIMGCVGTTIAASNLPCNLTNVNHNSIGADLSIEDYQYRGDVGFTVEIRVLSNTREETHKLSPILAVRTFFFNSAFFFLK